ncbi:hypothetical protein F4803DRAFT_499521 [Xylaria telfairii]|nr:hypothetical protein F4803DRAFT_499521 [Xylaria telfairii]
MSRRGRIGGSLEGNARWVELLRWANKTFWLLLFSVALAYFSHLMEDKRGATFRKLHVCHDTIFCRVLMITLVLGVRLFTTGIR